MHDSESADHDTESSLSWSDVNAAAVNYLARREHSQAELRRKLADKGYPSALVNEVIADLADQNLQSDFRYAEQYVRLRAEKGYGPGRIRAELRERGIDDQHQLAGFAENDEIDWYENCSAVRLKKFGPDAPADFKSRARQQRYLQYRGFDWEQIGFAMGQD